MATDGKKPAVELSGYFWRFSGTRDVEVKINVGGNHDKLILLEKMYGEFAEQGILGQDMRFRLEVYGDGSSKVYPVDSGNADFGDMSGHLAELEKIERTKRNNAGFRF
jgi:hypothetical protein